MKRPAVMLLAVAMLAHAVFFSSFAQAGDRPEPAELTKLASWLQAEFGLIVDPLPAIEFAPPKRMGLLRFRGVPSDHQGAGRDVVAVYDDDARTIYLPQGWTGGTPAELSVLVHEMVHHAQNLAGTKFDCPQAREALAYEAQVRFLTQKGSDLAEAFGVDGFTLLVLTSCGP